MVILLKMLLKNSANIKQMSRIERAVFIEFFKKEMAERENASKPNTSRR